MLAQVSEHGRRKNAAAPPPATWGAYATKYGEDCRYSEKYHDGGGGGDREEGFLYYCVGICSAAVAMTIDNFVINGGQPQKTGGQSAM